MDNLQRPGKFTHNDVKQILEQLISALAENNRYVELADDFFVKANIRITKKNRNRPRKRLLISEKDTSQENITEETTKFHFKTSFEETTSVSLATSQGFSANVGGGLSGGAVGGSLGLSSGLEYSKSKSFGQDKSRAQNKELTAEVEVQPNTVVIVKELTYEVEWAAMCDLELILRKEDKIEYKCMGRWRKKDQSNVEVKKLLKRLRAPKKALIQTPVEFGVASSSVVDSSSSVAVMMSSTVDSPSPNPTPLETLPETEISAMPPYNTRGQQESSTVQLPPSPNSNTSLTEDQPKTSDSSVEYGPTPKAKNVQFQDFPEVVALEPTSQLVVLDHDSAPVYDPSKVPNHVITDSRVLLTEHMLVIEFTSDCLFSAEEHKLEIIKLPSNRERVKRIIDHQTGVANQNDKEDMLLSLIPDRYTSST